MAKLAETNISNEISDTLPFDPIPFDLIPDILKGLPVKTLARFLCLSKQYASIIRNRDFMKSYLIKSATRPQDLIFTFTSKHSRRYHFFTAKSESSTSSSSASYLMSCHLDQPYTSSALPSVHGLICYGPPRALMVYIPSTRRTITLPKINSFCIMVRQSYVGYDPIDCDYKVLCIPPPYDSCSAPEPWVMTLGNGTTSWRKIENFPSYAPTSTSSDICINGVLYYIACRRPGPDTAVMSFDVRSEKFNRIKTPGGDIKWSAKLTKYEGKLALIDSNYESEKHCNFLVKMLVLLDAAKHEWSVKYFRFNLRNTESCFKAFCINDAGEFVLGPAGCLLPESQEKETPFHVAYYDPKKGTTRRVYIEGLTERKFSDRDKRSERILVSIFSGQVDNLMFL